MTLLNLERVLNQLRQWGEGWYDGAVEAQTQNAKRVLELSQVYVPVDTGALRSTGRLGAEIRELSLAEVEVRYGGNDSISPYAGIVHERLDVFHAPPTSAKYLQRAVDEVLPEMTLRIGEGGVASAKRRAGTT